MARLRLRRRPTLAHTPGTPLAPVLRYRGVAGGRDNDSMRVVLDTVAKQIIEQLQQDGRRSYASIGKAVGLSEAAVRQRVQRMIEVGAMQIVAVTDPMSLGFLRQTMIGVRCGGELERVAEHLAGMDEIDYVVITAGSFDLLIEVVCENDDQLLEILSRVRSIPSVTMTETFVYLKLCKQTYSWGTR
jgi:Lrp/AsnC family transcriptional regulator for asnA, asnC and gidA